MRRLEYTEFGGKRHRYVGGTAKRQHYLLLEDGNAKRQELMQIGFVPGVSGLYRGGSHQVGDFKPKKAKAHRFSPELELQPTQLISDRVEELPLVPMQVDQSQLIPAPVMRSSDSLPSNPPKRFKSSVGQAVPKQPHLSMVLSKDVKGLGYCKPGNPLANKPRVMKNQFAFDIVAALGKREFARTLWRHGASGYVDTDAAILSPAKSAARTYDNISVSTAIRKAHFSDDETLYSAISLWDLEAASWNANGFKLIQDSAQHTTTGAPTQNAVSMYADYKPTADHQKVTPFPKTADTVHGNQQRPPFLVNLGKGSINVQAQNRLCTDAVVEIVVFQMREHEITSTLFSWFHDIEDYVKSTTTAKRKGPLFGDQLGGQTKAATDPLIDPLHKFMTYYPKYADKRPPFVLRSREKFLLLGGANKSISISLPAQIYNSRQNAVVSGDPFAASPSEHSRVNLQTYMIYFAVNGVVMPVFTAPDANNNTATPTAVDYVNETVIDMQPCNANVLFTGEYIEHPRPCLATPQERVYDNHPELQDTTVNTALTHLVSGYVSAMPTTVNSGQVTAFSAGQSVSAGGPQG